MATVQDFFNGSEIAVWQDAIATVLDQVFSDQDAVLKSAFVSTGSSGDLLDRFGYLLNAKPDGTWDLESFRENIQELLQAYLFFAGTKSGVQKSVASITQVPPVLRAIQDLPRWLLGYQYLKNPSLTAVDGIVISSIEGPYTFTSDVLLSLAIAGQPLQRFAFPAGSYTASDIISRLNAEITGAMALSYGHRFAIMVTDTLATSSIQVESSSTADTILGLDRFVHQNAPLASGTGTVPTGWNVSAPTGSISTVRNPESAAFGHTAPHVAGQVDSPYIGMVTNVLLKNGGFENGFAEWDRTDGPDFYIDTGAPYDGSQSASVQTRRGVTNTLRTAVKPIEQNLPVRFQGFQRVALNPIVYDSVSAPTVTFRWRTSGAAAGYKNGAETTTPDPDMLPTISMVDNSVDFVAQKIRPGMALHAERGFTEIRTVTVATNGVLYAGATHYGVVRSTNEGRSWVPLTNFPTGLTVKGIATDPEAPKTVYVVAHTGGVYKSVNAGDTWVLYKNGIPSLTQLASVAVDPSNSNIVYAATDTDRGIYRSSDGGVTWFFIGTGITLGHVISTFAVDPVTPTTIYVGTQGNGIWKTTDSGTTWSNTNTGLSGGALTVYAIVIDPNTPADLFIGTANRVYFSTNSAGSWTQAGTGGIVNSTVTALVMDPTNSLVLYAANANAASLPSAGTIAKSVDGGTTWTNQNTGLATNISCYGLVVLTSNNSVVIAGTYQGFYRTDTAAAAWVLSNDGLVVCSYNGVIVAVYPHELWIQQWFDSPGVDTNIFGSGSGITYTPTQLSDSNQNNTGALGFLSRGLQTGSDYTTRDKLRVVYTATQFGVQFTRQIVRDITGVTTSTISVNDWAENATPPGGTQYFVYTRPADNTAYTIYQALSEVPEFAAPDGHISAALNYTITYFDVNQKELGKDTLIPTGPIPSDGVYRLVTLTGTPPVRTRYAQLAITVSPDAIGEGAVVSLDDISWVSFGTPPAKELHFSVDGVMQKLPVVDSTTQASIKGTFANAPQDGETIFVGGNTYEFDWGAHAIGTVSYTAGSDAALDGKTLTVADTTYLFKTVEDQTPASGVQTIVLHGTLDATFKALVAAINNRASSPVVAAYKVTAPQVTFTAITTGIGGNATRFGTTVGSATIQLGPTASARTCTVAYPTTMDVALLDAAQITGTSTTFAGLNGLTLNLQINGGPVVTTTFQASDTTITAVVARINGALAEVLAPATAVSSTGHVRILSTAPIQSTASILVVSGSALSILGFTTGQTASGSGVASQIRIGPKIFEFDRDGVVDTSDPTPHVAVDVSSATTMDQAFASLVTAINGDGVVSALLTAALTGGTTPLVLTLASGVDGGTIPFSTNQPLFTLTPTVGYVGVFSGGENTNTLLSSTHIPVPIPFPGIPTSANDPTAALRSFVAVVNQTNAQVGAVVPSGYDADHQFQLVALETGGEGNQLPVVQEHVGFTPLTTVASPGVNAADLVIPVASAVNFKTTGAAIIGTEVITYDNTNAPDTTHLYRVVRGVYGTTAASHSTGASVNANSVLWEPPLDGTTGDGTGSLAGGLSNRAVGMITFLGGNPDDGDLVVVGTQSYEFDTDGRITAGATPITVGATLADTIQALVTALNQFGDVTATTIGDGVIHLVATALGTAGNALPLHAHSLQIHTWPFAVTDYPTLTITDSGAGIGKVAAVSYPTLGTPTIVSVGTQSANAATASSVVTLTADIPAGTKVLLCIADNGMSVPGTPQATDSQSGGDLPNNIYSLVVGSAGSWILESTLVTPLSTGDTITLTLPGGATFSAVAWSVLACTNVGQNGSITALQSGSTGGGGLVVSVGGAPNSGEILIVNTGLPTANTTTFACAALTLVGRVGTPNSGTKVTTNPGYVLNNVDTLLYGSASAFADPDSITAAEMVSYVNSAVSAGTIHGVVASAVVDPVLFPHGQLVLTSTQSGCPAEMIIGNGSVNGILGFTDASGQANVAPFNNSGWRIKLGANGTVTYTTQASQPAKKAFGGLWRLRGWMQLQPAVQTVLNGSITSGVTSIVLASAAGFPTSGVIVVDGEAISYAGISTNTLTGCLRGQYGTTAAAHANNAPAYHSVLAQAGLSFDSGAYKTGNAVALTSTPQLVEAYVADDGIFTTLDNQIVVTGGITNDILALSDVFLISDINKCLHLADNTVPRNKQRSNRLYLLTYDNPNTSTETEAGLIGQAAQVDQEALVLPTTGFVDLKEKDVIPHSAVVERAGFPATGTLSYTGQPENSSTVLIGFQTFQFGTSTNGSYVNIPINGGGADATWTDFVTAVNANSTSVSASINTTTHTVTVTTLTTGVANNTIPFTTSSGSTTITPITGTLLGGVNGVVYHEGTDYTIQEETGQISRVVNSTIPDPSPVDLVVSYAHIPGGFHINDAYPQSIKPVGVSLELDHSCAVFCGNTADFNAGVNSNFSIVTRAPDRFSYLAPMIRGSYAQVLTNYLGGNTFQLDYPADPNVQPVVVRDGIPLENASTGWTLNAPGTQITFATSVYSGASVYEIQYMPLFQWTSAGVRVDLANDFYTMNAHSFKRYDPVVVDEDVQVNIHFDDNLLATLKVPAIADQALAVLTRQINGVDTALTDSDWQFVDPVTVHIQPAAFTDTAVYTLTYRSAHISIVSPITEVFSYSTCNDNNSYPPFTVFNPGDIVKLSQFVKFRVQMSGDFREQDYRFRGFSAFLRSADLKSVGYGTSPYSVYGYGDPPGTCGFPAPADTLPGGDQTPSGEVTLTGTVVVTPL